MTSTDTIRNGIIDKLLTITNIDYLTAIHNLVEYSKVENDLVKLSESQIKMLKMSDLDIEEGNLISQKELDKNDLEWLKRQ